VEPSNRVVVSNSSAIAGAALYLLPAWQHHLAFAGTPEKKSLTDKEIYI
jgi:hypothetical protein